jgi:hypothetical protein
MPPRWASYDAALTQPWWRCPAWTGSPACQSLCTLLAFLRRRYPRVRDVEGRIAAFLRPQYEWLHNGLACLGKLLCGLVKPPATTDLPTPLASEPDSQPRASASDRVSTSNDDAAPPMDEAERSRLLNAIRRLYEVFRPQKLENWGDLVTKYHGREAILLAALRSKYCIDQDDGPAEDVRQHIKFNHGKRFRGLRVDGSSGARAQRPRVDYDTRERTGDWTYKPPASRPTGDALAALLIAWHSAVNPFAVERVLFNPKTGKHVRSITNIDQFVNDNMPYVTKLFKTIAGPTVTEEKWFNICYVRRVIDAMLAEACLAQHGRWQWRQFHLGAPESEQLSRLILKAYIAGSEHDDSD